MYVNALEKENYFLREEIEKAKFSKDKNDYSKFVSGLLPLRDKKSNRLDESTAQDENKNPFNERKSFENQSLKESNHNHMFKRDILKESQTSSASYNHSSYQANELQTSKIS